MRSDPTLIGTVQDVAGTTVSVSLVSETVTGLSFFNGESYRIGQVGSFVRIPLGYTSLFGIVSQVGAGASATGGRRSSVGAALAGSAAVIAAGSRATDPSLGMRSRSPGVAATLLERGSILHAGAF